ncbi:MAG TPA: ATP-binding protein [Polyangia bacterium]|jgi:signal transduction histidine kinase/ActR/RegA family two-component response regulator
MRGAVRAEQIRTLYRQSVWVFAANPVNALIVALVLRRPETDAVSAIWVGAMMAIALARLLVRRTYLRREPPLEEVERWARRFVAGTTLTGLCWGVGCALLFDPQKPASQLVVTFVLGGMIAGASGTLASYVPAFVGFATPALAMLAGRIAFVGDSTHAAIVGLMVVYGVVMTMVATNTQRALVEALRLRFYNEELSAQLRAARGSLEEANRTLEDRVTERTAAFERQSETLRDAQRMESVGLLAGGIAHDFNNLLTVVLANVSLLQGARLNENDRLSVEEIRSSANRGASLVSQLLAFSRRQILKPRVLDLARVVAEMDQFLGRLIGSQVELVVAIEPGVLPVKADPSQLQQVIVNLATNARDAMPDGGRLTIETTRLEKAEGSGPKLPPGTYAGLVVRDTGVGMDEQTRRLAFDPFFTTKELGRGTGLGLATVYGIVEQSGGFIFLESQPGRGSVFSVYFPVSTDPVAGLGGLEPPTAPPPAMAAGTTVLLAEDNPMVRAVASRMLREGGYRVIEGTDGENALQVAQAHDGVIDLLVTDLVMVRMGGIELAKRLTALRPNIRVLFISGFSWDGTMPTLNPERGVDFLQKPFTPDALIASAARLLAAPRPDDASALFAAKPPARA